MISARMYTWVWGGKDGYQASFWLIDSEILSCEVATMCNPYGNVSNRVMGLLSRLHSMHPNDEFSDT